ncbi:MAG: hypothetical protein IH612_17775 [Desulfofustis sp.]|nr:hypothetical protein [Desulfofustis sp.]
MKSSTDLWIDRMVVIVLVASFGCWLVGLAASPPFQGDRPATIVSAERPDEQDPAELALARAYWTRYPDVASHSYFGENGVLGIDGARSHYSLHGKAEGRRWGPVPDNRSQDGTTQRSPRDRCTAEETALPNR